MGFRDIYPYARMRDAYYAAITAMFGNSGFPCTVNGYRLRFHPRYYRWFPREYEAESFEFIKRHVQPGTVCVDIGAHFGLYSIILAKYLNCRMYSFEPTRSSGEVFRANIRYNDLGDRIKLIPKAVSSETGEAAFYVQETLGSVANSLVDYWHSDEKKNKVVVDVVTLDSFFEHKKFEFLKVDAEGVEYDVLLGAKRSITRYQPKMILGLHPAAMIARGHTLRMVWELLDELGYVAYLGKKPVGKEAFCARKGVFDVVLLHSSIATPEL